MEKKYIYILKIFCLKYAYINNTTNQNKFCYKKYSRYFI